MIAVIIVVLFVAIICFTGGFVAGAICGGIPEEDQ